MHVALYINLACRSDANSLGTRCLKVVLTDGMSSTASDSSLIHIYQFASSIDLHRQADGIWHGVQAHPRPAHPVARRC